MKPEIIVIGAALCATNDKFLLEAFKPINHRCPSVTAVNVKAIREAKEKRERKNAKRLRDFIRMEVIK